MMSPVTLAIAAVILLLAIVAVGTVFGCWLRSLLRTADTVKLSGAGRGRRQRPTIDRGATPAKTPNVGRSRP